MIKEIFKKQVCITGLDKDKIEYTIRLAASGGDIEDGALSTVLQSDKSYLFQPTDKLFFLAGCTVPRFKVKQLCEATGMTTVKAIENSTVTIYGDDTENSITRYQHSWYNLSKERFLQFIEENYPIGDPVIMKLKTILEDPETYHNVDTSDYSLRRTLTGHESFVLKPVMNTDFKSDNIWVSEESKIMAFDRMLEDGRTLVHQNDLLTIININNVMDKEMYEQTDKMFSSEDENNHVLALEIMANCDYEKSALYLWLLMKDHSRKIYNRPESKHVNYQALCKFFDIKRDHRPHDIEDVIQELSERNLIHSGHREEIYRLSKEEFSDRMGNEFYNVTEIETSEKMEKVFKRGDAHLAGQPITEDMKDKEEEEEEEYDEEEIENDNE